MKTFSKKPTSIEDQIKQLQARGMIITSVERAKMFLSYCSYYRFCGYALHFEYLTPEGERTHSYKPETSFDDVEYLYHFDAALRRLIFHYTSLIEINFRGSLCNESAWYYDDAHWFLEENNFQRKDEYEKFLKCCYENVDNSREIFITRYKNNYPGGPELPPIWMLTELMSFAVWSKLYQNLSDKKLKKKIASEQGVPEKFLISWLKSLTVLRNACAHHARIWNRNFTQPPLISPQMKKRVIPEHYKKISVMFLIIFDLLKKLGREQDFVNDLEELFSKYQRIKLKYLGITKTLSQLFS